MMANKIERVVTAGGWVHGANVGRFRDGAFCR